MNTKKITAVILAALLLCAAIFAGIHLGTRSQVPEGSLCVTMDGKSTYVLISALAHTQINGSIINGKGQEKPISGEAVRLEDVLEAAGIEKFTRVCATANDEYSAVITAEEILNPSRVYIMETEKGLNLVVFGDSNSRRNVSDVSRLGVE